mgnify:CR=1 FL=1
MLPRRLDVAQAAEVARVKRYESGVLRDPITISPGVPVRDVIALSRQHGISGFPVLEGGKVVGIVTGRDLRFETRMDAPVREIMTPRERLIYVHEGASLDEGKQLMHKHRLERVLVVTPAFELRGLMTVKDITKQTDFPNAARDAQGKLRVGAAVGVAEGTEERVDLLVKAGGAQALPMDYLWRSQASFIFDGRLGGLLRVLPAPPRPEPGAPARGHLIAKGL